jgi:hypothetical protein
MTNKQRTFHQAAYQFAAEHVGTHHDVRIDDASFATVTAVAVRGQASDDGLQLAIERYQLTLYLAAGQWMQLDFDRRANVTSEAVGGPENPPSIAQAKEVF